MKDINKVFVIQRILEVVEELQITAYEFAKHISMSEVGVSKILNGKVKNPNEASIKEIITYLNTNHFINLEWLLSGSGLMKDVLVPKENEFSQFTESQKNKKIDEIAVFIAHHEEELMQNPIFRSIIERRGYQTIIKKLRDKEVD